MKEINIATAQFQTRNGDKEYNLSRIEALTAEAAGKGAQEFLPIYYIPWENCVFLQ